MVMENSRAIKLLKLVKKRVECRTEHYICNAIGRLRDEEGVSFNESQLLKRWFQSQRPTISLHEGFYYHNSFEVECNVWWCDFDLDIEYEQRVLFLNMLIEKLIANELIITL